MMRVPSLRQGKGELYIQKLNSHNAQTIAGVEHSGARCRVTHPNDESTASPVQAKRRRASLLYTRAAECRRQAALSYPLAAAGGGEKFVTSLYNSMNLIYSI